MIAYFNCFSGISGDMILGALVDAGVPFEELNKRLALLSIRGYKLQVRTVKRAGIRATKVDVVIKRSAVSGQRSGVKRNKKEGRGQKAEVRRWKDIEKVIKTSALSNEIKQKGLLIFKRLFEAEAKVHGEKFHDVHLHELGAVDCIVDIFGALIGLDILGIKTIYSSPLNLGSGMVKTEHGLLSVPAPATVQLLKRVPVYSTDILFELTTPTGAVLISSLAKGFSGIPEMKILKTGTGAGNKDFEGQPNVLTMMIGEKSEIRSQKSEKREQKKEDKIVTIETNIDDMNPQIYEYVMGKLFKAGALDVFLTQIIMKKSRPGIKLSVLCNESNKDRLIGIILSETTSIGVRFYQAERKILQREIRSVKTKYGNINSKITQLDNKKKKTSVEYEDCRKIAEKFNIPLLEVMNTLKQ